MFKEQLTGPFNFSMIMSFPPQSASLPNLILLYLKVHSLKFLLLIGSWLAFRKRFRGWVSGRDTGNAVLH